MRTTRPAYSLIELLVIVVVIGILASLAVVSLSGFRARGRDANRKASVDGYVAALELSFLRNKTYLVGSNGTYVGYVNSGMGRVVARRNRSDEPSCTAQCQAAGYPQESIAERLLKDGFLSELRYAPGMENAWNDLDRTGGILQAETFHDFYLTVCTNTGAEADDSQPTEGRSFAIFTYLEQADKPERSGDPLKVCGGPDSSGVFKLTNQARDLSITRATFFNYARASRTF